MRHQALRGTAAPTDEPQYRKRRGLSPPKEMGYPNGVLFFPCAVRPAPIFLSFRIPPSHSAFPLPHSAFTFPTSAFRIHLSSFHIPHSPFDPSEPVEGRIHLSPFHTTAISFFRARLSDPAVPGSNPDSRPGRAPTRIRLFPIDFA